MGVAFDETVSQWLTSDYDFPPAGSYRNVRLVLDLLTPTTLSECFVTGRAVSGTIELTGVNLHRNTVAGVDSFSAGKIYFYAYFSGGFGIWISTGNPLTTGVQELFITYDGSSTSNVPVFYVNGSSVGVSTYQAPTGTINNNTITNCTLGGVGYAAPNGRILACNFITGRIVSAAEVLEAYNSRKNIYTKWGLVFAPNLNGAAGVQVFDGTVLGATNYFRDEMYGTKFTPQNSPVGYADRYLTFGE